MTLDASFFLLLSIGLGAGLLSGLFGVGGGVVIVPALIYFAGFDQRLATGTSLAVLLAPVGLGAVIEYYSQGQVDVRAAAILAVSVLAGALVGAIVAREIIETHLRLAFAIFVLMLGIYLLLSALRHLAWI